MDCAARTFPRRSAPRQRARIRVPTRRSGARGARSSASIRRVEAELAADIRHTDCRMMSPRHVTSDSSTDSTSASTRTGEHGRILTWTVVCAIMSMRYRRVSCRRPTTRWTLIFTSGSTGAPKAVRGTQAARALRRVDAVRRRRAVLPDAAVPRQRIAASFVPALTRVQHSRSTDRSPRRSLMADIRLGARTSTPMVVDSRTCSRRRRPPTTATTRSGSARPQRQRRTEGVRHRFGVPIVQHGPSEGGSCMPVPSGCVRVPTPGQDVVVVDPEPTSGRVRDRRRRRLLNARKRSARSCTATPTAHSRVTTTRRSRRGADRNGWYWSGDLAYRDDDGVFYFAGRNSDWIRGRRRELRGRPVERIIGRHEPVAAVAVYGVPDPVTGDRVMATLKMCGKVEELRPRRLRRVPRRVARFSQPSGHRNSCASSTLSR